MQFNLDSSSTVIIQRYDDKSITINDVSYGSSLLIQADGTIKPIDAHGLHDLSTELMNELLNQKPEMIIIGAPMNNFTEFSRLTAQAQQQGVGIELMEFRSACRTYQVLLAENRNACAILLLPSF